MKERLITLGLALAALLCFYALFFPKPIPRAAQSLPLSTEAGPDGYLAAWRWLAAAQVPLGSLRYRYPRLGDAALSGVSEGNVLIMTLPQRLPFQSAEWKSLDEWVGRGNTLVVLAGLDDTPRWMEPRADPQLALQRISHIRFTAEKAEDDWGLRDLLEPRRIEFVPRGEHPLLNGVQSMYAVSDLPAGRWRAHSTDNSMPLAIARRSDANQSVLWLKAAGRGQIIVCAFATPFSNRAIGQADNAQLLSNIVAWTRAPSGSVIFDDAHQGLVDFYDASAFFGDPRLHRTLLWLLLLWLVFVLNLAEFYALQSWLPTILTGLGHSLNTVALATSLTTVGGIVAAFVIGPAMDRLGPYGSLAAVYFAGVLFVGLLGHAVSAPSWALLTAAFCAGFCISGAQKSVIALAAIFYPTPIRSTGVGWALGIGRLGGIGGPLLVGALLACQLSVANLFYAAAVPMLLSGVLVVLLGKKYGP